jgi:quaternary ammonium compound-resistance protein SugE
MVMKSWIILILSGLGEVVWSVALNYSNGFSKLTPSIVTIVFMLGSFFGLSYAMKSIPLGTAYAVFTGIGAVGASLYGIVFLDEPKTFWRLFFILTLILSITGLKLVSPK